MKIFDLHVHLRDNPQKHLAILKKSGYRFAVAMANVSGSLDTVEKIIAYKKKCQDEDIKIYQVSALSEGLAGKKLVNIKKIKKEVVAFSDDGKCLRNTKMLEEALSHNILIMAHLEPEIEYLKKYLRVLQKVDRGRLHFQHITKASSLKIIRRAKEDGLAVSAETAPHYLYLNSEVDDLGVNPPLGGKKDQEALIQGIQSGIIDCIASDYAPIPRKSGFAGAETFLPLCLGLVERKMITLKRLEELIYLNPQKILFP